MQNEEEKIADTLIERTVSSHFEPAAELGTGAVSFGPEITERYEILTALGEGGMSEVYKARHRVMGTLAAVKVLREHLVYQASNVQRFQVEARAAGNINHENVVKVFDCGTTNGQPYLIMEYIEGRSLAQRIASGGKLALAEAVDIFRQVCAGLEEAHGKGIVHRDLKPSNIMLAEQGGRQVAKIVDFGIAKLMPDANDPGNSQQLTKTGEVFGSPLYMSPEQCMGRSLDARSDIYSMGCLMFETLCGKPPFCGESQIETMMKHINDAPPVMSLDKNGKVGKLIEQVVLKALAKEPGERYQTMAALKNDLIKAAGGSFMQVQAVRDLPARWQRASRKEIALVAAAVLLIVLAFGSAYVLYTFHNCRTRLDQAARSIELVPPLPLAPDREKGDFQSALKWARLDRYGAIDGVEHDDAGAQFSLLRAVTKEAELCFDNGHYARAAKVYSDAAQQLRRCSRELARRDIEDWRRYIACMQSLCAFWNSPQAPGVAVNAVALQSAENAVIDERFSASKNGVQDEYSSGQQGVPRSLAHKERLAAPLYAKAEDEVLAGKLPEGVADFDALKTAFDADVKQFGPKSKVFDLWVTSVLRAAQIRASRCATGGAKLKTSYDKLVQMRSEYLAQGKKRDFKEAKRRLLNESPALENFVKAKSDYNAVIELCKQDEENRHEQLAMSYCGLADLLTACGVTQLPVAENQADARERTPKQMYETALENARKVPLYRGMQLRVYITKRLADMIEKDDTVQAWTLRFAGISELQ